MLFIQERVESRYEASFRWSVDCGSERTPKALLFRLVRHLHPAYMSLYDSLSAGFGENRGDSRAYIQALKRPNTRDNNSQVR